MNGKKIKHILIDKNISQLELAQAAGVSQAFMSYVLKGLKEPSLKVIKRMADYLGVTVDEIL